MTYLYAQPNLTGGVDSVLTDLSTSVPIFPAMILAFIFFVIVIGGTTNQRRRTGTSDLPFWGVLGGMACTLTVLLMTMGTGMINLTTLGITIAITIMFGLWFFLSKVRGEQ